MTDNETIKALGCCGTDMNCHRCPAKEDENGCIRKTCQNALDLINHQKAEIAKYNVELEEVNQRADEWHREAELNAEKLDGAIAGQETLQKALAEKIAEGENQSENFKRLVAEHRKLQTDYSSMQATLAKMSMGVAETRNEAIKEFAERLNDKAFHDMNDGEAIVCCCDIDDLVKEMVGAD